MNSESGAGALNGVINGTRPLGFTLVCTPRRLLANGGMARPIRFQYPGAIYHVMARGDGGKAVFET
jgi:hypothetical protein